MRDYCGSIRGRIKSMLLLTAVFAVVSATFASFAIADKGGSSVNNGGGTPSCGNSCDSSGNPTDFHKPCTPVPGNGCHTLPDTPCERGHGNAEANNKHCAPDVLAQISLAYADTYRQSPPGGLPSPWQGSSKVIFVGCGYGGGLCPKEPSGVDSYDAGAIMVANTSTTDSLTVTGASVAVPTKCTYNPWPGLNVTVPPGFALILTQTGIGGDPCLQNLGGNYNFDTSESAGNGQCQPDGLIPVVSLTINGSLTTINDTGQILNTKGFDQGTCPINTNEAQQWVPVT